MSEGLSRQSRYRRPRFFISWSVLIVGIMIGITGGLFYAWNVSPLEEFDTSPWQLRSEDKAHYIVALMLAYDYDGDLNRTINGLIELRLEGNDVIQQVANTACELASTGYVDSTGGERAIRAMMKFYQLQGRTGCADELVPMIDATQDVQVIIAATPTITPLPSKTPIPEGQFIPTDTPEIAVVPTVQPQRDFRLARLESFCDADFSGVIEVFVQDLDGITAIPGAVIRVSWADGESSFITGLKPERGADYADFQMEANKGYSIEMPGLSDPSTQQIVAAACIDERGRESLTSYRAVFRPTFQ